jgi:hypothetical protein
MGHTVFHFKEELNVSNKSQYSTINCYLAAIQRIKSERILSCRNAQLSTEAVLLFYM